VSLPEIHISIVFNSFLKVLDVAFAYVLLPICKYYYIFIYIKENILCYNCYSDYSYISI